MTLPSKFDNEYMPLSRQFINETRQVFFEKFCNINDVILDIGNQEKTIPGGEDRQIITLDLTDSSNPDVVGDITKHNDNLFGNYYDAVMCTEVLEHVVDPFAAVRELRRIVKTGGCILVTTPLNTRIHGPIPDCWRFTEFGLRVLLRDFNIEYFNRLDTPNRNLFPLHYGVIVRKISSSLDESDPRELQFTPVD